MTLDSYTELYLSGLWLLLGPFTGSLKEIVIYANITTPHQDPLYGLCQELEVLARQTNSIVLETLIYNLTLSRDSECSTADYYWGKLDRVIHSYAWPMLKTIRVNVNLERWADKPHSETADFRRRLDALPEKQLPRLFTKSRKDLDFRFFAG